MIITSFLPVDKWEKGILEPEDEQAALTSEEAKSLMGEQQKAELAQLQAQLHQQAMNAAQEGQQ